MKNLPTFAKRPELWDDPYFVSMLDEAEYARMTRQEKEQYRNAMKREWDYWNTIDYARKEGVIKGREEGLEKGRAEGRKEGRAEGIAQEQRAIAQWLLAAGLSEELIASSTTLSIEQVRALQNA